MSERTPLCLLEVLSQASVSGAGCTTPRADFFFPSLPRPLPLSPPPPLLSFTVNVLWWYEDPDSRAAGRHDAHEDARVVAAGKRQLHVSPCRTNI